jgi:3',5'-cyclic AMP phosphodiesterase CpdA
MLAACLLLGLLTACSGTKKGGYYFSLIESFNNDSGWKLAFIDSGQADCQFQFYVKGYPNRAEIEYDGDYYLLFSKDKMDFINKNKKFWKFHNKLKSKRTIGK